MANNTTLNTGTGGDVIATDDVAGVKYQRVKLMDGTEDSTAVIPGDATNGLDVDVTRVQGTVTVSGTVTANAGTGTLTTSDSQTIADNAAFTDGTSKVFAAGYVFDEVAGTALTENDAAAARIDSKRAQVGVIEDATTRGQRAAVSAAGRLSVDASGVAVPVTDNSGSLTVDAPVATPVFVRLSDGAAAITALPVTDNAGSITVDATAANFAVNSAQVAGTTTDTNSGNKSAGTQRVVLATDQPQLTNALKVDGSAVTQPVSGTVTANIGASASPAGLSKFHLVSAATTNATNVKASAGKLHGWYIYNSNAAARKVAFHNTSGTPTAGTSVTDSFVIPPTSAANAFTETGIAFSSGIAITTVTDLTDAGATAVAANDLIINLYFI